jgi:hypothetical protein
MPKLRAGRKANATNAECVSLKNHIKETEDHDCFGMPRSGISLMMQMLAAGGMPILSDGERQADVDNRRGCLEWERIKQLPQNPGCIAEAQGKAVKVTSRLLLALPDGHEYRVIFMQRPLPEVLASQEAMLRHRETAQPGADTPQSLHLSRSTYVTSMHGSTLRHT